MTAFNLSKIAKKNDTNTNYNKMLEDSNKEFGTKTTEDDAKNVNLKLPTKDKDSTVPFEKQLEAARKDTKADAITEKAMDKSDLPNNKRTMEKSKLQVSPINVLSESYDKKKAETYKKAEDKLKKDVEFWDKYVGAQLQGESTKVYKNPTGSQLQNNPDRFKIKDNPKLTDIVDTKLDKMVTATIKDADALLFHVYATAAKEGRDVNADEQSFINRVNAEKEFVLAQGFGFDSSVSTIPDLDSNILIRKEPNGSVIVLQDDNQIDIFESPNTLENMQDARDSYPEAPVEDNNV